MLLMRLATWALGSFAPALVAVTLSPAFSVTRLIFCFLGLPPFISSR
jgi:hypothetical protein